MEFTRIKDTKDTYWNEAWNIYNNSFPLFEQRALENQIAALSDEDYYAMVVHENGNLIGILFYWHWDNYKYLEHLAINKELRGGGYGSKIVKEFCDDSNIIILEIDPLVGEVEQRRLRFYEHLGFKLQDIEHIRISYRSDCESHRLEILSYNKNITEKEYKPFINYINLRTMKYSQCYDAVLKSIKN